MRARAHLPRAWSQKTRDRSQSIVPKGPDAEWDSSYEPYQCVPRVRGARGGETIGLAHDQEGQHEHHRPQPH